MKRLSPRALAIVFALIGVGVALDQWTKVWAAARLPGSPIRVIPGLLTLEYVENRNAAFGLFGFLPDGIKAPVLLVVTSLLTVVLIIALIRTTDRASQVGFAFTICGALGNIVDRIQLHYVRDFILMYWDKHRWPNYNVADMLVCTGVAVLVVLGGRSARKKKDEPAKGKKDAAAAKEKAAS